MLGFMDLRQPMGFGVQTSVLLFVAVCVDWEFLINKIKWKD